MLQTLWIMRHGLAEDHFESDFNRELSLTGEKQAIDTVSQLMEASNDLPIDMLVSPFIRTQSTAKIVHAELGLTKAFETDDLLVHFGDCKLLGDFLLASHYKKLMIVSHMPIVAQLCQYLSPDCNVYGFQTAQCVRMDFDSSKEKTLPVNGRISQSICSRV